MISAPSRLPRSGHDRAQGPIRDPLIADLRQRARRAVLLWLRGDDGLERERQAAGAKL